MIIAKGTIYRREPIFSATIDKRGTLNFVYNGEYRFVVDTGFTGDIAVPPSLIPKLDQKFLGYDKFVLATKRVVDLPVFQGWVKVMGKRYKVKLVPGDELLGMGLLERIGSKLVVDFTKAEVKLLG